MVTLISVDGAAVKSSLQKMLGQLDIYGKAGAAAVTIAQVEFAEKLLNEMKAMAPKKTYALVKSGHIEGPRTEGDWTVVEIVWDSPYARIQDEGGTINPKHVTAAVKNNKRVFNQNFTGSIRGHLGRFISRKTLNTARLFVPLRPGVKAIQDPVARAAAGYKFGVDYVLARQVTIDGSEFITKVLKKYMPNAARNIGMRAEQIWNSIAEKGKL